MIEVKNLTKYYNGVLEPAVKNVSFCANPGEITILLGPNGYRWFFNIFLTYLF